MLGRVVRRTASLRLRGPCVVVVGAVVGVDVVVVAAGVVVSAEMLGAAGSGSGSGAGGVGVEAEAEADVEALGAAG